MEALKAAIHAAENGKLEKPLVLQQAAVKKQVLQNRLISWEEALSSTKAGSLEEKSRSLIPIPGSVACWIESWLTDGQ